MTYDLLVIGSGPAGQKAALSVAKAGLKAAIVEPDQTLGGGCVHKGTLPSKSIRESMYRWSMGSKGLLGDPLRDFSSLFPTLFSKAGNLKDKLLTLKLRNRLAGLSIKEIFQQEEISTLEALSKEYGFSSKMINQFFAPFFSGIFLEKELTTSRRMFDFVFKMFSSADTAVPNLGMEEIPKQLAQDLPAGSIHTEARVKKVDHQTVQLEDGSTFSAPHIIIATEATGIIQNLSPVKTKHQSTTHLHFIAQEAPIKKPLIALNTKPQRLVNNICTINRVAPGYAPDGQHLVSLSVVGRSDLSGKELESAVRKELSNWFGNSTQDWEHLHTRTIEYALPGQSSVRQSIPAEQFQLRKGLYACGDFQLNGSINAAMKAGRKVGELVTQRV